MEVTGAYVSQEIRALNALTLLCSRSCSLAFVEHGTQLQVLQSRPIHFLPFSRFPRTTQLPKLFFCELDCFFIFPQYTWKIDLERCQYLF